MSTTDLPKIYNLRKGSPLPPKDAAYVGRRPDGPGRYGNPFEMVGTSDAERNRVCDEFEAYAVDRHAKEPEWLAPLKGKDLVCWCQCPTDEHPKRCHAETLRRLANEVRP